MAVCEKCAQNLMSYSQTTGHRQSAVEPRVYLDGVSLACYEAAQDVAHHCGASSITTLHFVYAMAELSASARILESWNISPAALSRDAEHALTSSSTSGEGSPTGARLVMSDDLHQLFQIAMQRAKRDGARVASFKHLTDAFSQAAQVSRGDGGASLFLTHVTSAYRNRQHSATAADRHQHRATSFVTTALQATRSAEGNTDTRARTSRRARDIPTQISHQHASACSCRQTSHQLQLTTRELNRHISGLNARLTEQDRMLDRATRELQQLRRASGTSSAHRDQATRGAVANDDIQRLSRRLDDMAMLLTDLASSNQTRRVSGEDGTAASGNTNTTARTEVASTATSSSRASACKSTSSASRSSGTSSGSATTHAARQSNKSSRTSSSRNARSSSLRGGAWTRSRTRSRSRTGTQRTRRRSRANRHQNLFSRLRRGQRQRFLSRVRSKSRSHWGANSNTGRGRGQSCGSGSGGGSGFGSGVGTPNPNFGHGHVSGAGSSTASGRGNRNRGSYELTPRDGDDRKSREDRELRRSRKPRQREQRADFARDRNVRADRNREDGEQEKEKRFYLNIDDDIVDGPSIGPKTAARLYRVRLNTVRDLLECDPDTIADQINARHITADVMRDWQDQARLVCVVPWLRGTHAQILVGAGFRDVAAIVAADNADIMSGVLSFATSSKGQSVLRSGEPPELEKVLAWIEAADQAELQRAA